MHHIDGLSTAAAQYQAYLERMRLAHAKEDEEDKKVRRRNEGRNFNEHMESGEDDSEENGGENQEQAGEEEAAQESPQGDGFGSHYA